jgi:magnesium chelatase family protein
VPIISRSWGARGGDIEAGPPLTTVVPEMTLAEAIETTCIHSVAGLTGRRAGFVTPRPFRAPHQTMADVGLIGGGQVPMPGGVSLAHHGGLLLDKLQACTRYGLDVLRSLRELGRRDEHTRNRPTIAARVQTTH